MNKQAAKVKAITVGVGVQITSILFGTGLNYHEDGLGWTLRLYFWPLAVKIVVR